MIDPTTSDPITQYLSSWFLIHFGVGGLVIERLWQFFVVWRKKQNGSFIGYKDLSESLEKVKSQMLDNVQSHSDTKTEIAVLKTVQEQTTIRLEQKIDAVSANVTMMSAKIDTLLRNGK